MLGDLFIEAIIELEAIIIKSYSYIYFQCILVILRHLLQSLSLHL